MLHIENRDIKAINRNQGIDIDSQESTSSRVEHINNEGNLNTSVVNASCSSVHFSQEKQILFSAALVYIKGRDNICLDCRALLDSGSQINFITSDLVARLKCGHANFR